MALPPQDQTGSSIPMAGIGAGAGVLIVIVVVVIVTVVLIRLMMTMTKSKCLLFSFRIQNFFIYSNSFSVKKKVTLWHLALVGLDGKNSTQHLKIT